MKLAVAGLLPADLSKVDDEVAWRVRAAGFAGCSCFFADPTAWAEAALDRLRDTLHRAGVAVAQVNAHYECLVHPDASLRRQGIATLQAAVRVCQRLQGDNLYVRPGSMNPNGHWLPHPANHAPETLDRLVDSLQRVAAVAEDAGVTLALEGHTVSPLDTPQIVREVIDRVGSPALKFNCDYVNFISGVQDVYHSRRVIDRLFDTLGDVTWAVHAKDADIEDRHVLHISEVVPGRGRMDLGYMLQRFAAARPEGFVIIEHLPDDKIPEARDALLRAAEAAGVIWSEGES
ncbi:MAG: sugar phosphate isomerase/epimerase [Abditibacteriales bacterium]|nr:sugar phosphate isomerase/epimerase [Abditibacteriales bacterium]MDW8365357.1 sugar phosphate isomerase/epimerase family protein [Abditibacteriales bacterium]